MKQVFTQKSTLLAGRIAAVLLFAFAAVSVSAQSLSCPSSTSAGANQSLCGNSFTMNASAPPLFGSGAWTIVSGSASIASASSRTSTVTLSSSSVVLRWTVSRVGCTTVSATVTLTNLSPTTANAGAAKSQCNNAVFTMTANAVASGETGTWSVVSGAASITSVNSPSSSVTVTSSPAVLRWTMTKGSCSSTSTVTLTNTTSTVSNAGAAQTKCNNASFTMAANAVASGETGAWSVVSGAASIASLNSRTSTVTVTTSPAVLRWTITKGSCSNNSTVTLTNNVVTTASAGSAQTKCNNNSFTMAATAPGTGETGAWSIVSGAATIASVNSRTSTVTVTTSPAVLRWTLTKGTCTSSATVTLTNNTSTTAAAGPAQSNCNNNVFTMAANAVASGETGAWTVVSGAATITSTSSPVTKVTVTTSPAVLRWTITKGSCSTNATVTLTNTSLTVANAGTAQTKCRTSSFTMAANAVATGETGTWSVVSGAATISGVNSRTAAVTVTTSPAVLRWTITKGSCSTTSTVTLTNVVPTTANAGAAQTSCNTSVFTLAANAAAAGETGTWSVVSGTVSIANVNSPVSNVTVSSSTATLRWTIAVGSCTSTSTVLLTRNTLTVANAGTSQTQCNNSSFSITGNAVASSETGKWAVVSGAATIANVNSRTTTVNVTASPAVLSWTITKATCSTTSNITLTNNTSGTANAGTNQTQCNSNVFTLAANAAGANAVGTWSVVSGAATIANINSPTSTAAVTSSPAVLKWTLASGNCSTSANVTLSTSGTLVANAGANQVKCNDNEFTLSATAAGLNESGVWSVVSGAAEISDVTSPSSDVVVTASPAVLQWKITSGQCADSASITLTNKTIAYADAGDDQTNCDNNVFTMAATVPANGETGVWSLVSGEATIADINSPTTSVTVTESPAVLKWKLSNGECSTDINIELVNSSVTAANAGPAQSVTGTATPVDLAANTPAEGIGTWSVVSGPSVSSSQFSGVNSANAIFTPAGGEGEYVLQWSIANGPCVSSSTVNITVIPGITNIAPVANAGKDTIIMAPASSVTLDGSASSDADGTISNYKWSLISGPANNYQVVSDESAITAVNNLTDGLYLFRLKVTDNLGGVGYDTVAVSVGNRILVDVGYNNLTNSPDEDGKYWNNLTDAKEGVQIEDAVSIANIPSGINLEVVHRVDGTYATSANGLYTNSGAGVVGKVGDYPATATDDYAYVHPSAANGQWKLTGLDSSKQYSVKFWGSKLSDNRFVQIKLSDAAEWKEYDAANNRNYDNAAVITFSGKKEATFDIKVKSGSTFGYINVVDITSYPTGYSNNTGGGNDTTVVTNPPATHDSDILNCGKPFKIVILGSSTAYGNGATPIDSSWARKFTAYVKRKNAASEVINLAVPGYTTYQALNPDGFTPPSGRPLPAEDHNITAALDLHPDAIIINLPTNDAANNYSLQEQKDNYERALALADDSSVSVWVTTTQPRNGLSDPQYDNLFAMRDWIYTRFGKTAIDFWSTVATADGEINDSYNYDGIHVVNAGHELFYERVVSEKILDSLCSISNGSSNNIAPVAHAGNDTTIMLPTNSVALKGSSSTDSDGVITSYKWIQVSGPETFTIADANAANTTVSNLQEGIYRFELEVRDNGGLMSFDTVSITVGNRILVDIGYSTLTTGPDAWGKYWNNLTNATAGVRVPNAVNTGNVATGIKVEVINRVDGTYSPTANGLFTNASSGTVGDVGDYPATATDDYAYVHPTATNGQWKISGLDSTKQYTIKFWGSKLAVTNRFVQIKRNDQTVWQEYDASDNRNYNKAAVFTFTGKKEMTFDIAVKSGSTFGYINVIDITALKIVNDIPTAVLTRGPYLASGTQTGVTFRWRTSKATDSKVSFGTSAGNLTQSVTDNTLSTEHTVTLTGLTANTLYYYNIGSSVQTLQGDANNYFKTSPVTGSTDKIRILVMGDMGNNSENQENVRNAYLAFNGNKYTDGWILLGDNAYNSGTDNEYQSTFFDYYQGNILKNHILWPAPGNHDYANNQDRRLDHNIPYYDIFNLPKNGEAGGVASNTESYYSYNYGNIHFVSLDSYGKEADGSSLYDTSGIQAKWMKQDLAANTLPWTIVFFHHPPYTRGSHNSDEESELVRIRQRVVPILERFKVDMVLNGHSHSYERSFLLNGHYGTSDTYNAAQHALNASSGKYDGSNNSCVYTKNVAEVRNGIVYAVVGSSGQLSGSWDELTHPAMYYSNFTEGGSMFFEVENNRLDAKWISDNGVVRDNFTIMKDVNNVKNITVNPGTDVTLTASWAGQYNWSTGATTKSITVNPTVNTSYSVTDGSGCITDMFNVITGQQAAARPGNAAAKTTAATTPVQAKVYPTMVRRGLPVTVQTGVPDQTEMLLTNVNGAVLKRFKFASSVKVETGNLLPGIYLLRDVNNRINTRIVVTD
ncbi:MAG: metallophosphoesterase [Ferruginibacter sp.]